MRVLLLCTSHNDLGLIRALRKLGTYIIATGYTPNLPGEKYIDEYIRADYSDQELVLKIAQEKKIDAICQCCNDFGVYTAAYVAEKMHLPGYDSYETTLLLHNKDRFKRFAENNHISSPKARSFDNNEEVLTFLEKAEYPLMVKPTDGSAGNGVQRVDDYEDAVNAVKVAFDLSKKHVVIIEPFIIGSQHGFCTFLREKKVVACCSNNEYSFLNPYRVEIDTFPADNYLEVKDILIDQIEKMANILDLKDGIFHLQYIMHDGVPQIIEVMRRVLGNMYSVPGNLLTGLDWDYWETRAKCGLSCELMPTNTYQEGYYAYKTILSEENGIIKKVTIPSHLDKYLIGTYYVKKVGDKIINYKRQPIGFLFFMFSSDEEMKEVLIRNYEGSFVEMGRVNDECEE